MNNYFPNPRIQDRYGAPVAWFYTAQGGRKTFASDTGDVGDLAGNFAALARPSGVTFADSVNGRTLEFATIGIPSTGCTPGKMYTISVRFIIGSLAGYSTIVGCGDPNYMLIDVDGTGKPTIFTSDGVAYTYPAALGLGTEHSLTLTRSGDSVTGGYGIYLDGAVISTNSTGVWTASTPLGMGCRNTATNQPLTGSIGDLKIYTYVLSPTQIARDYADPFWRLRSSRLSPAAYASVNRAPIYSYFNRLRNSG